LPTYEFEPADLVGAIGRLLADQDAAARLSATASRLRIDRGVVRAADLIETVAREHAPVPADAGRDR
jgi:UDP:flavonoid glycosyltransferase YjiC (YdhE family)